MQSRNGREDSILDQLDRDVPAAGATNLNKSRTIEPILDNNIEKMVGVARTDRNRSSTSRSKRNQSPKMHEVIHGVKQNLY